MTTLAAKFPSEPECRDVEKVLTARCDGIKPNDHVSTKSRGKLKNVISGSAMQGVASRTTNNPVATAAGAKVIGTVKTQHEIGSTGAEQVLRSIGTNSSN